MTLEDYASLVAAEILPILGVAVSLADYRDPTRAKTAFTIAMQVLVYH